ncbi:UrcA family protein [Qipengyuania sp. 1NDH17]|uniref:UrcA family protein n=1 Tax=Qipengyuania polymorpha TaxID=2867234 RepID=A0ABS7IV35_9SPHN|nr:UrcA family protein [Qipengyuania polymorpha]MBX7457309.1 UrcA family protein [Qipengyuania polymorpha]
MKKTFAFAAAALAVIATPAAAKDAPSVSVATADLDLTQSVDQEKLERRIENAARRACRLGGFDAETRRAERECRLAMAKNAAKKVELAIAAARSGRFALIKFDGNA